MRKDTISKALDLLGERHIAYVTDKKPRGGLVTTSLREVTPAPEPGIFRHILNTAAVILFASAVIVGFILMRQSIGPGNTPADSLTDTTDTETNETTDTEPIDTEDTVPPETEDTKPPETTDTEPVETIPTEPEEAYFEYKIYFIPNIIRNYEYKDNYELVGYHLTVDVYEYITDDGADATRILVYYDKELLFESTDCDYAYDIERIFEEAQKFDVAVYSNQNFDEYFFEGSVSIRDCVLTDFQQYVQIYPDEFSKINILEVNGIAEVAAEIGGEASYPLTSMCNCFISPLHDSTEETMYIICVMQNEESEKDVYVEFAVERKTMSATEIARYYTEEYRTLAPYKEIYGFEDNNFTVYEDDGQKIFVDENYDLCRTDKKTGKTALIHELFSLPEWREYAEEHGLTIEESGKIPHEHINEAWVWNERYLICQVNRQFSVNLEDEDYCVIYDLVSNETAISNIGKMYCMTDDRLLVRLKPDNSLGLDAGYYYVDYADNYKKIKFVSVDSFNEISEGCDQQTWDWFNDFVISSDSRYVVMHESRRSWIDNIYADVYVVDLLKDTYSKYYFCSENGRMIAITESNELLVVNREGKGYRDPISYLDAYIYILDLDD